LIHKRLISFFQKHSILAETQYGFQHNKSTTHAVLDVMTAIYDQINDINTTALV